MSKNKSQWDSYKWYTLADGTKFRALNDSDAKLYENKEKELKNAR